MKFLLLLLWAMMSWPAQSHAQLRWSVGYWTPRGAPAIAPEAIQWSSLTHVVHAWALVRPDGSLDLATQQIETMGPRLIAAAHARGVRVLLGIGQPYWQGETNNLLQAVTDRRTTLVNNILAVVDAHGFDGVDIDWEPFNAAREGAAVRALVIDLRARLGKKRQLSATAIVTEHAFWPGVAAYLDKVSVMTYDLGGTFNPYSWHNSALYASDARVQAMASVIERFIAAGLPRRKINIGIPFFGYDFSGGVTLPGQPWPAGVISRQLYYQEIAFRITQTNYRWDAQAMVPYLTGVSFVTFDDERSITEKVNYAKTHDLGGWIIWELAADYFPLRSPTQPLLDLIGRLKAQFVE